MNEITSTTKGKMKLPADVIFKLRLVNRSVGQPYLIKQNYVSGPKQ
jgi:hypothetical protein